MIAQQQRNLRPANFPSKIADAGQSASGFQQAFFSNQGLGSILDWQAVGNSDSLPTACNPRQYWDSVNGFVGEIPPSYYVREGVVTPSLLRRGEVADFEVDHRHSESVAIFALDLGTQTGWAVHQSDGRTVSGSLSFKPHRFEGGGMRYLRFRRWLNEVKGTTEGLDAVYFEEVRRHAGTDAAHVYGGFLGQLTAWCEHHRIPYQGVPVSTIKQFVTGKARASKAEVIAAVERLGFRPADDNEADALALLAWALGQHREG